MKNGGYAEVAHTADLALRVWGRDFYALISNAALGMYHMMGVEYIESTKRKTEFILPLSNRENILVDFLSELLFLCEEKKTYLSAFTYRISNEMVQIFAEENQIKKIKREIKAVTYYGLEIVETENGLETTLTFDV